MSNVFEECLNVRRNTDNLAVTALRRRHNLPEDASLMEAGKKAAEMFKKWETTIEAVELVLGEQARSGVIERMPQVGAVLQPGMPAERKVGELQLIAIARNSDFFRDRINRDNS